MFVLQLNRMTGNSDHYERVARASTREELEAFLSAERVTPYADPGENLFDGRPTTWRKSFRKGGPLEWFNDVTDLSMHGVEPIYECLDREQYVAEQASIAGEQWDAVIGAIPIIY